MITILATILIAFLLGGAVIAVVGASDAKVRGEERIRRLQWEQEARHVEQQVLAREEDRFGDQGIGTV